ncbi:uncharacterized protein LOC126894381 [Daktulosphaira vitifoliae]|uniref:uncharacterized protein LOC126894381 n=1 Tax=Daktulosphaira vitifoliae TaxID=58002 RepID=UPI0021AA88BC|nr:uncharacterized protein LOC126894381 [Daktulosphaira vitifoliae]
MHDLLEGVCDYELTGILRNLIINSCHFSLETLNQRIHFFNDGPTDIRNRPQGISEIHLKISNPQMLKMNASETWCFTKYLGLIIGDLVPKDILKNLIDEHHQIFINLMKTNLKPKHHHMVHYPLIMDKIGPLINIWSMCYEAKHKESKVAAQATSNRKNICYTLFLKNQLIVSHKLNSKNNSFDPSILFNIGKRIVLSIEETQIISNNISEINNYKFVSWVEWLGTRFSVNSMC